MPAQVLDTHFDGFVTDISRDQLPQGKVFRLQDHIPQNGAPARKRGGWAHASGNLNSLSATSYSSGCAWYERADVTDGHLIAIGNAGKVYQIKTLDGASGTYIGTTTSTVPLKHKPLLSQQGELLIFPGENLAGKQMNRYYWTGSAYALASLGTNSEWTLGCLWADLLVLGGYRGLTDRLYFTIRGAYNKATIETDNQYWDMPEQIVTVVGLPNELVIFGIENTWALVGSTPPPGGNLSERQLFAGIGCIDARSVASTGTSVCWANASGVFRTDGSSLENLTDKAGVSSYWRSLLSDYKSTANPIVSGDYFYGYYIVSVGNHNSTLFFNLATGDCFEWKNVYSAMFAHRGASQGTATITGNEELFFSNSNAPRVQMISGCWLPATANKNDADGTNVLPVIETGYYTLSQQQLKRMRRAYVSYDLRSAAGTPALRLGFTDSPESQSYTTSSDTLPIVTKRTRSPVGIRRKAVGMAFKIDQTEASDDTSIYGLEIDGHDLNEAK